jgi:hypothetical protein
MLKQFVLLFAIVAVSQQALVGGYADQTVISDDVMDLARWTMSQLSSYTNGVDHTLMTVKNLKTQLVNGVNYKFSLDVVVTTADNKYEVIKLEIQLFDVFTQLFYFG